MSGVAEGSSVELRALSMNRPGWEDHHGCSKTGPRGESLRSIARHAWPKTRRSRMGKEQVDTKPQPVLPYKLESTGNVLQRGSSV